MYGHANRIAGQDKGSGKLPVLLDCCALTAYSCLMTTSDNAQRDELADEIAGHPIGHGYYSTSVGIDEAREIADDILAAGYRKPRTITTVKELDELSVGSVVLAHWPDGSQLDYQMTRCPEGGASAGGGFGLAGGSQWLEMAHWGATLTVLCEPKAEATQ